MDVQIRDNEKVSQVKSGKVNSHLHRKGQNFNMGSYFRPWRNIFQSQAQMSSVFGCGNGAEYEGSWSDLLKSSVIPHPREQVAAEVFLKTNRKMHIFRTLEG